MCSAWPAAWPTNTNAAAKACLACVERSLLRCFNAGTPLHAHGLNADSNRASAPYSVNMASPKLSRHRQSKIGAIYVVTSVTDQRASLFAVHTAAYAVINEIARCENEGLVGNHAWVVMPDHIHWMLELRCGSLECCIQKFKSRSAHAINMIRHAAGPVWQPGFYDRYLRTDEDLRAQARYIAMNPVRAALVAEIGEYPYWWCRWIADRADL